MKSHTAQRLAAGLAAAAIALGAMGAHAVGKWATAAQLENWRTAAHYHLIHAVALWMIAAWCGVKSRSLHLAWWILAAGLILFSGGLYSYVLTGVKLFAHITPIGGVCLLAGWVCLAFCPPE